MRSPRRAAVVVLLLLSCGPLTGARPARFDAGLEALQVALELERKSRADDVAELERLTALLSRVDSAAAVGRSRAVEVARAAEPDPLALRDEEEKVGDAEARARALQDARRIVAARIAERSRRIAFLGDEMAKRRAARSPNDPLTGRWDITVNPGNRRGILRLSLDGTIVAGDYTLDGGFRGSVRGTFVAEKVSLQRIDAERGLDAYFYGRIAPDRRRITGTWEATALAPTTGPVAGTWVANGLPDIDESDGGAP